MEPYVLDATLDYGDGLHCFCPVVLDEEGIVESIVVGLNFISTDPPKGGRLVGIVHMDGNDAVNAWCDQNRDELDRLAGLAD